MVEEMEKGAQRPAHRLACSRAPILGVALNVADHVLLADLAQVAGAGWTNLTQKPADRRQVADDGPGSQTPFPLQIIAEILKYLVLRSSRLPRRWRDRARVA